MRFIVIRLEGNAYCGVHPIRRLYLFLDPTVLLFLNLFLAILASVTVHLAFQLNYHSLDLL